MKIVHWAPFAPNRCGLYEAARDFARADYLRGHEVLFCDTGVSVEHGKREDPLVGRTDIRGGWLLETSPRAAALDADLWVCHDGVPDSVAAQCQVPMVWAIHGRPLSCFRPEQNNLPGSPFTIVKTLAEWPRVKALVTMWEEFKPYWSMIVGDKLRCTVDPPIDGARYSADGNPRQLDKRGTWNVLIADSWRDDIDIFEVAVGCYYAALQKPGTKIHFWAVEDGKQVPWQHIWAALDKIGALGEIHARETDMDHTYRAMDCLVSPHRIGVRTIGEALSCGLPVVAASGNRYTPFTADPADPLAVAGAVIRCLETDRNEALDASGGDKFSLGTFGDRMEDIYQEAVGRVEVLA